MASDTTGELRLLVEQGGLQRMIDLLSEQGYEIIGPRKGNGAITLGPVGCLSDLPVGVSDTQEAGYYRLGSSGNGNAFDHATPSQSWKRYLYPPAERLWQARSDGGSLSFESQPPPMRYALLGMRACDLSALHVLDAVLGAGGAQDTRYVARRSQSFVVAVNCTRAAPTCFCASMGTGPHVRAGFDVALTELSGEGEHAAPRYLARSGSEQGLRVLSALGERPAEAAELRAEGEAIARAERGQHRSMVPDVADLLQRNLESRQWNQVAGRCLGCANCTMVCPTCFCATVEDVTDLSGERAERWRKWDSCFTAEFSYIHGGSIRRSGVSRYRQWITHKLSGWWQQFEMSGCVGCGRCITWCPVGIDITEEARTLRDSEGGAPR